MGKCLKWHEMGPAVFFPTNPDLADILGDMDLEFEYFHCLYFSGPWKKLPQMAQNGARSFFPTNPDLADMLGRTDLNFNIF